MPLYLEIMGSNPSDKLLLWHCGKAYASLPSGHGFKYRLLKGFYSLSRHKCDLVQVHGFQAMTFGSKLLKWAKSMFFKFLQVILLASFLGGLNIECKPSSSIWKLLKTLLGLLRNWSVKWTNKLLITFNSFFWFWVESELQFNVVPFWINQVCIMSCLGKSQEWNMSGHGEPLVPVFMPIKLWKNCAH